MKYLYFYFPFGYLFRSRLYTFYKALSWFIVYIIPVLFLFTWNYSYSFTDILYWVLALLLIYNYYEIGYIQNDTETIKKENTPTLRLKLDEFAFYEKHKKTIYAFRIIVNIGLLLLFKATVSIYFVFSIFSILILYLLYNNMRNRWNLLINSGLVLTRYVAPLIFFGHFDNRILFYASILIYPLLNFFERASSKRFNLVVIQRIVLYKGRLTVFRVLYYLFFVLLYLSCGIILHNNQYYFICCLFVVLLLFRFSILIGERKGLAPSNYLKA